MRVDRPVLDRLWPDLAEVAEPGTHLGPDRLAHLRAPSANAVLVMPIVRPRPGAVMFRIARDTTIEDADAC